MSTGSGSSVAETSRASEPAPVADEMEGGSEDLEALEREVEREVERAMADPPNEPAKEPAKADPPKVKPSVSGNIAEALSGGSGLTPSQLHTPELEEQVVSDMKKLSDEQFQSLFEDLKQHPEFPSYCEGIRLELGEGDDDDEKWVWGEHEPYLDVVGLLVWAKAKQNMSHALGLAPPRLPAPSPLPAVATPVNTAGTHPALAAKPAEPPAPLPKAVAPVVTPAAIVPTPHTMFFMKETPAPSPKAVPPAPAIPVKAPAPAIPVETPTPSLPAAPVEAPTPSLPAAPAEAPPPSLPAVPVETPTAPAPSLPAIPVAEAPAPLPPVNTPATPTPAAGGLSRTVDAVAADVHRDNKPNSSTHRKEYMAFLRAAKNPIFG